MSIYFGKRNKKREDNRLKALNDFEKLEKLKEQGFLTEKEYERLRKDLVTKL